VKTVHALELSGNNTVSNTAFPRGTVVEYKNVLWKCLLATVNYPPISYKIKVPEWQVLLEDNNPFKADLFVINGDRIEYVIEIVDTKRKFRPNTADSSLLTWNLSYHH
jgi:hypothetical protein